jgi:hypothetical protein
MECTTHTLELVLDIEVIHGVKLPGNRLECEVVAGVHQAVETQHNESRESVGSRQLL